MIRRLEGTVFSVPSVSAGESSFDFKLPNDVGGVDDTSEAEATELVTDVEIESIPERGAEPTRPLQSVAGSPFVLVGLKICDIRKLALLPGLLALLELAEVGLGRGCELKI